MLRAHNPYTRKEFSAELAAALTMQMEKNGTFST